MQDEPLSQTLPLPRARRSMRGVVVGVLLAFVLGAGLVGWLAWRGGYDFGTGLVARPDRTLAVAAPQATSSSSAAIPAPLAAASAVQATYEQRVSDLEAKLARLELQAQSASANTARAEGLLVALAARRATERGAPLGYLEDQLKLRFGDAQPNAVQAVIAMSHAPVTLDALIVQLQGLGPQLEGAQASEGGWARVKREVTSLFVVRRDEVPAANPQDRIDRARQMLRQGQVDEAVNLVRQLPGSSAASGWIAAAQRYAATQRALDQIETAALLEPRELKDDAGRKVDAPSPLVTPAPPTATPSPSPSAAAPPV